MSQLESGVSPGYFVTFELALDASYTKSLLSGRYFYIVSEFAHSLLTADYRMGRSQSSVWAHHAVPTTRQARLTYWAARISSGEHLSHIYNHSVRQTRMYMDVAKSAHVASARPESARHGGPCQRLRP